ncbi:MDR family MFS transporter [Rhodococcus qingshengii]|uniref:MDR family MFS transporter n=1 Tax=Rhodococcus qingshengii TaxID=334542 RepID=UPI0037C726C3
MAITLIVGALGVVFDTTIVSVALNDLAKDLNAPISTIQWVSTGYMLAVFLTLPLAGWAQARIGGRRLWMLAIWVFLAGSILCAFAWDASSLIAFRVVQGLAGGIMMPLMYTLLLQAAGGKNIGKIMAIITVPTALGPILGPVLGGLILSAADWSWLFLVNIPFSLVGLWLAMRNLPSDRPEPGQPRVKLDVIGLLLLSPGAAVLLYALTLVDGSTGFVSVQVLAPLIAGILLIAGFTFWALARAKNPLIDLRIFKHRSVASSASLLFLGGIALFGTMMLLPIYFQQVRGATALEAGILLIPQGVGALLARGIAGKYMDKVGPRAVAVIAFTFVAVSTIPFAFVGADTNLALLWIALFVRGIALGAAMIAPMGAAFIGLGYKEIPDASMITRIAQQLGGAVGVAVLLVILQRGIADAHTAEVLAAGFDQAFWWSIVFNIAAVPLCFLLPRLPKNDDAHVEAMRSGDEG